MPVCPPCRVRRVKARSAFLRRITPLTQIHLLFPITQICTFNNGDGGNVDYQAPADYDHLNRNADQPVYNHLNNGGRNSVEYEAPAEYDHLNRQPADGAAYEVALPVPETSTRARR